MKVLVVEDDRKVAGFIEMGLREEGYAVDVPKSPVTKPACWRASTTMT